MRRSAMGQDFKSLPMPPDLNALPLLLRARHWLVVCLACGLGTACMSVRIEAGAGEVRVVRHFGLLMIELAEPPQAVTGTVSGVGLIAAPLGWSLGYTRQRWAVLGEGCRAVIWVDAMPLDAQTRQDADGAARACLLTTESSVPSQSTEKEKSP